MQIISTSMERIHKKQIRYITSLPGQLLSEPKDIQDQFCQFYKGLMGTSAMTLPSIDVHIMKRGPTLSRIQRIKLCADISDEEIYEGSKTIGNDKAPGWMAIMHIF